MRSGVRVLRDPRPHRRASLARFVFQGNLTRAQCFSKRQYNLAIMSTRTNETWLSDLRDSGLARELALEDLRAIIQKGLPFALSRWLSPDQPQFNALVDEVT